MDLELRVLLVILLRCLLTTAQTVEVRPEVLIIHEGFDNRFACVEPQGSTNLQWIFNDSPFESLNLTNVTIEFGGLRLQFRGVPLEFNGTTVQCTVMFNGDLLSSNLGTLLVQGRLDSVSDVNVEFNSSSFIISWTAPFSYDVPPTVPPSPPTSYCISITNTNTSTGSTLVNETCEIEMTQYPVILEYNPCMEYSARIIAVNPVGNGEAAVIPFPAPGVITSANITVRAEGNELIFEGSLSDPVCTCEVVGGAAGNCMANTDSTITFSAADSNELLDVSVTLSNVRLSTVSEISISTYDIQSIGVDSPAPNAVTLSASYIENSPAMGIVFALLFIDDDAGSVNFTKSVYLVLDRVESNQFMQGNISQGDYTVLAFDVEGDGMLERTPAAEERVVVDGEDLPPFSYPPVAEVQNCSVATNNTNLMVSCDFNTDSVSGYFVMLQFADNLMLLTDETQDDSPVVFEGLTYNGLYNVIVFPLTENGIAGANVAFTEEVIVTSPSTTPPTSAPTTTLSTDTTTDSAPSTTASEGPSGGLGPDNVDTIVAAVVVVLLLVIALCVFLIILVLCFWWRNRLRKHTLMKMQTDGSESEDLEKDAIISPEPGTSKNGELTKTANKEPLFAEPAPLVSDEPPQVATEPTGTTAEQQSLEPRYAEATANNVDNTRPVAGEPQNATDEGQPKEPMYAEALKLPTPTTDGVKDSTAVQYGVVSKTVGAQGVLYEMVSVKPPKSKTKPDDPNLVEYAELTNLGPSVHASPAIPPKPAAPPPPRPMTAEEMFVALVPIAEVWKPFSEKMGVKDHLIDEIFTNNDTDLECLRNIVDMFHSTWTKERIATILQDMGKDDLAGKFDDSGKQDERPLPGQAQDV